MSLFFAGSSCKKFLKVDPPSSQVTTEVVFQDDLTATAAMTGIYNSFMTQANPFINGAPGSITALTGLSADELHHHDLNPAYMQVEENALTADNDAILKIWQSMYNCLYQANSVIEGLQSSTSLTRPVKKQLMGEALFVRAYVNFYLVNLFGDIPLSLNTDYTANAVLPRTSTTIVYASIVDDLRLAQDSLIDAYPSAGKVRPNKMTATALLSRVYLYTKEWAKAETEATKLLTSSSYKLEINLNRVFLAHTTSNTNTEAIWQLMPLTPNTANYNTYEGYYFALTAGGLYNKLRSDFITAFEPNDQRRVNWIGTVNSVYFPNKYKVRQNATITEYKMMFRLGEQFLIRAEARANQNKLTGPNSAASDIDSIRIRAGLPVTTATDQPSLLAAIEQERRVELFTEDGQRWFDLKRWNRATAVLSSIKTGWTSNDMLYPLPEIELNRNPYLRPQNTGY
ncbi:MAG TPA: RagB/SusD family nutrient uptake outer membrane protein [Chitinophagaceae bacterium]|nr:RagB/SusD family nutrient uptake outer membrane protein [Chitinophagaceae bacterium]